MHLLLLAVLACNPSAVTPPQVPSPAPAPTAPQEPVSDVPEGCHPELVSDARWTGGDLNTAGYRCYKLGQYPDALTLFDAAIARDPNSALAHYNLACTLSLLRRQGQTCPHDATLDHILDHLEQSVALDAERRKRMREDPDLAEVQPTLRYRVLDGARLDDPVSLAQALVGTRFYQAGGGAFGSTENMEIQASGKVLVKRRTFGKDGAPSGWEDLSATWALEGTTLVVTSGGQAVRYTVTPQGDLTPEAGPAWRNLPSECSA